jgi:outer membrane protein TolC
MRSGFTTARAAAFGGAAAVLWATSVAGQTPEPRRITLEEARTLSTRSHPATVAAEGTVELAEASRLEALGAFLPGLTVTSGYTNSSNERFDQTTGRLISTSYSATTQATYDVFTAGRKLANWRSALARLDAADASLRASQYQTALQTTAVYYDAAAATELLRVAERRLERARQQLSFANVRLEVGTATRSDVLRAELEVGNAELAGIDAASALRSARLELGRQVGLGGEVQPVEASLPEEPPALASPDSLAALAERTAPLAVSAQAVEVAARVDRLSSYTSYLPSLRLVGGYDWQSPTYPPRDQSWSLRLTASLPVFNGFQREASIARAAAAERTAEARARDAALAARAGAIDAAQQVESAGRRVAIARRAVELAQEDLRVQEERYQMGVATILELQTSQVALVEVEAAFVTAKQRLGVAVATLEAVLGVRIGTN